MARQPRPGCLIGRCLLAVAVTMVLSVSWPSVSHGQDLPAGPQVFLDTTYAPPTGGVITVPAGGDFQAALNAALPGQIIELEAGATYAAPPGGFVLPAKATPDPVPPGWNPWIYVRSSAHASLPAPGSRVSPADASLMPKIVTQDDLPAIRTGYDPAIHWVAESPCSPSPGEGCPAHHYRVVGIEVTKVEDTARVVNLVKLETLDPITLEPIQRSLSQVPTDIVFDRCYIHGTPTSGVRRGIAMNSARTAVIDSYVSDIHEPGADAAAINAWNGPGPFKIVNNFLEAATVNVMFGGAPATIPDLVPSDIEMRRNHLFKRLSWMAPPPPVPPGFIVWPVKNLFELKNARRLLVDGNIFENIWTQADQGGFAIVFTPRNEDGTNPWAAVSDVTFTHNIIRRSTAGMYFLGADDNQSSQQLQRVLIQNNLFFDIGKLPDTVFGGVFTGVLFLLKNGTADVTIDHNTAFQLGRILHADGPRTTPIARPVHTGFSFSHTIVPNDRYGFSCDGFEPGEAALDGCLPGPGIWQNAIYGPWAPDPATDMTPRSYGRFQRANDFPVSVDKLRFEDLANCNFRLRKDKDKDTSDGWQGSNRDFGVDQDALELALGRTVLSIWPLPPFCN